MTNASRDLHFELRPATIFVAVAGSHAQGLAGPDSDLDLRGICVPPLQVREALFDNFEQWETSFALDDVPGPAVELFDILEPAIHRHESARASVGLPLEVVVFDLRKFLRLCAKANPNALEILFADERDWLWTTAAFTELREQRSIFLTKELRQSFHGYAMAQLRRIEHHRSWLLHPPKKPPERGEYGLEAQPRLSRELRQRVSQVLSERLRVLGVDDLEMPRPLREELQLRWRRLLEMQELARAHEADARKPEALVDLTLQAMNLPESVLADLKAEARYQKALAHWRSYESWKRGRNRQRAETEAKFGYDTKHASHLLRMMLMGAEVMRGEGLKPRRDDPEELLAVRRGAYSFEQLLARSQQLERELEAAMVATSLPPTIDRNAVSQLYFRLIELHQPVKSH